MKSRFISTAVGLAFPIQSVLTSGAAAQVVTPPRQPVLSIGSSATATAAPVTIQDGNGQQLPFLQINPTTHLLAHIGDGSSLNLTVGGVTKNFPAWWATLGTAATQPVGPGGVASYGDACSISGGTDCSGALALGRTLSARAQDRINVKDAPYGAKGDKQTALVNITTAAGSAALAISYGSFVASDAGKVIVVPGAGAAGAPLTTTIATVVDPMHVTLGATATTAQSAVSGTIVWGTDDSAALYAAVGVANNRMARGQYACIYVPGGNYLIGSTAAPVSFAQGRPGCIVGDGPTHTEFSLTGAFGGDFLSWSESWGSGTNVPGATAMGFRVDGTLGAAAQQNALVMYDRMDNVVLDDIDVWTLPGRALYSGAAKNTAQGYMRESHHINNIRAFFAGLPGAPAIEFTSSGGAASGDATNELTMRGIDIFGSNGPSFVLRAPTGQTIRNIKVDGLRIEGLQNGTTAADLLTIGDATMGGQIHDVLITNYEGVDPYTGYPAVRLTAASGSVAPYNILVQGMVGGGLPNGIGLEIDQGRASRFHVAGLNSTTGKNLILGANVGPNLTIDANGAENALTETLGSGASAAIRTFVASHGDPALKCLNLDAYDSANTQICSGQYAFQAGAQNTTSGSAAVSLGQGNTTNGNSAVSLGNGNNDNGNFSTTIGNNNSVFQNGSTAIGQGNTISGSAGSALAVGYFHTLTGTGSFVAGQYGTDRGRYGWSGYSPGRFAVNGDAQAGGQVLRGTGATASAIRLTADGAAAGGSNVVNLPSATIGSYSLRITLTALDLTTPANTYSWSMPIALLSKTGAAQSTTVLALGTPVTLATGASGWTGLGVNAVLAQADTTNGGLNLSFTPPAGNTDTVHVAARVESVEVQ